MNSFYNQCCVIDDIYILLISELKLSGYSTWQDEVLWFQSTSFLTTSYHLIDRRKKNKT